MYYLWLNDEQAGPYTLQQVQSMWNQGKITALTLYWQEGQSEWLPLNDILSVIEPGSKPTDLSAATKTAVIPPFTQHLSPKTAPTATPETIEEEVVWTGHPTLWKWAGLIFVAILLLAVSVSLYILAVFPSMPLIDLAPLPVAFLLLIYIFLSRTSTLYTVSNKRVSLDTGLFTKTSRELRIQDIRSIAAKVNFLGYGDLEFSSAASDDVDVVFVAVPGAGSVRDLVKKLQS